MRNIIPLVASIYTAIPSIAFGDEAPDDGGKPAFIDPSIQDDGDSAPDFSALDEKYGYKPDHKPAETQEDDKPVDEKPVGEKDDAGDEPGDDEPDFRRKPEKKAEDKPEEKGEEDKPEDEKPEDEKKDEKPEDKGEIDPDAALKELESLQPPKGATQKSIDGWNALKARTKEAYEQSKQLKLQLDEIKKSGTTKTPEEQQEIEALKKEVEDLRQFRQMIEVEEDPEFKREFSEKIEKADSSLLDYLVNDPALQLNKDTAAFLKDKGLDSKEGREVVNEILTTLQKGGDHLLFEKVKAKFLQRDAVVEERVARSNKLREDRDKFFSEHEGKAKQEADTFKKKGDEIVSKIAVGEWCNYKEIPKGADKATIEAINKHNESVKGVAQEFFKDVEKAYMRDPETLVAAVYAKHDLKHTQAKLQTVQKELEQAQARIKELASEAQGVRKAKQASPGRMDAGDVKPIATADSDDAGEAIDRYVASLKR